MHTDDLLRLVAAPARQDGDRDWSAIEAVLGTRLPSDYKWLVEHYGPGSFDEFVHVFQPGTPIEPVQLEKQAERTAWALDYLRSGGEAVPYENSELLSVCKTDNGDVGYWLRRPADSPDSWNIVVNEARGPRWSLFDGGIVEFLVAVLSGNHRVTVFPDDFPSDQPEFAPYEA
jgi:hypothetical protein